VQGTGDALCRAFGPQTQTRKFKKLTAAFGAFLLAITIACGGDGGATGGTTQPDAPAAVSSTTPPAAGAGAIASRAETDFVNQTKGYLSSLSPRDVETLKRDRSEPNRTVWCSSGAFTDAGAIRAARANNIAFGPDARQQTPERFRAADDAFWDSAQALVAQCGFNVGRAGGTFNQATYNQRLEDFIKAWTALALLVGLPDPF
jgi:hypothetical protein